VRAGTSPAIAASGLEKIREVGVRRRAEQLYQQLDMLQRLRQFALFVRHRPDNDWKRRFSNYACSP
jgi:hypothetical protein